MENQVTSSLASQAATDSQGSSTGSVAPSGQGSAVNNAATDMQEVIYEKFRNLIREQIEELNEKLAKNRRHLQTIKDHQQSSSAENA